MVQVKPRRPHGTGKGAGWTKAPHAVRAILEGIVTHLVRCSPRSTHDAWLHPPGSHAGTVSAAPAQLPQRVPDSHRSATAAARLPYRLCLRLEEPPIAQDVWRRLRWGPSVTPVTPSVAWSPAQDEDVGITAGVHHPLGHVHGELRHRFDLRVGFTIVQDETEFGHPAVEMRRLTQLRSAPRPTWAFGKWCGRRRDGPPPAVRLCSESPGNFQSSGIDRRQRLRYLLGISAGNAG